MDLFLGTVKRPKLRSNRTVIEVDRDRTETETWTEWCAKNRTGPGLPNPVGNKRHKLGFSLNKTFNPKLLLLLFTRTNHISKINIQKI